MGLSSKQQAFIDEYIITLNATEAVIRANYKVKNRQRASEIGYQLLQKTPVSEEITRRLKERHLTADMVLARLGDMATSNLSDFAHIRTNADLAAERERGYLVKKFKRKITNTASGSNYEDIELELYDAQRALELIGKHHKLFTDKVEIVDETLTEEERINRISAILKKAKERVDT